GEILFEDHNHVAGGDHTQHPEFAIARWAANNLTEAERQEATVYTSGEHCPMCAAAHGWVGLGRIVYASSSAQLSEWMQEFGVPAGRVKTMPIEAIITATAVAGPDEAVSKEVKELHRQLCQASGGGFSGKK